MIIEINVPGLMKVKSLARIARSKEVLRTNTLRIRARNFYRMRRQLGIESKRTVEMCCNKLRVGLELWEGPGGMNVL